MDNGVEIASNLKSADPIDVKTKNIININNSETNNIINNGVVKKLKFLVKIKSQTNIIEKI